MLNNYVVDSKTKLTKVSSKIESADMVDKMVIDIKDDSGSIKILQFTKTSDRHVDAANILMEANFPTKNDVENFAEILKSLIEPTIKITTSPS